jgi:hypothetical protein
VVGKGRARSSEQAQAKGGAGQHGKVVVVFCFLIVEDYESEANATERLTDGFLKIARSLLHDKHIFSKS